MSEEEPRLMPSLHGGYSLWRNLLFVARPALAFLSMTGCASVPLQSKEEAPLESHECGKVLVLGTLGSAHLGGGEYGLATFRHLVESYAPTVVIIDQGNHARYPSRPELDLVLYPMAAEGLFELIELDSMGDALEARWASISTGRDRGPVEREYLMAVARWHREESRRLRRDVFWYHSDEFRELSGAALRWYAYYWDWEFGAAGEMATRARQVALTEDAIREHSGGRVLVVVRTDELYFIQTALQVLPDIPMISAREWLLELLSD